MTQQDMTQHVFPSADSERRPVARRVTNSERPVTEIIDDLWHNTQRLARQELELALTQLERKTEQLKTDLRAAVLGGAVLYAGLLAVVAASILLLSKVMDPWIAALLTGAVVSATGMALVQKAKREAAGLAREQARATAEEISYTAKEIGQ